MGRKLLQLTMGTLLLAFAFSLSCSIKCFAQEPFSREVVKVGVIVPLTGGDAKMGSDIAKSVELLQSWANSKSQKYRYEFLVDNGKCGIGSDATTIATKFITLDKVKFLLTACSGETMQVGALAQKSRALTIAVSASSPDVTKIGDYVFRTFIDISDSMRRFTAYMKDHVDGQIALLSEDATFTMGIKNLLTQNLGDKIAFAVEFPVDSADFATIFARVKSSKVKAVYLNAASDKTLAIGHAN